VGAKVDIWFEREHARTLGAAGGAEVGRLQDLLEGRVPDELAPKFPSIDEILVVVAGGAAWRLSAGVPGWKGGEMGSRLVTRAIADAE
jgi:hypothetical protein